MTEPDLPKPNANLTSQLRRDVLKVIGAGSGASLLPGGLARANSSQGKHKTSPPSNGLKSWAEYVDLLKPAGDALDLTFDPTSDDIRADLYRQLVMNIAQGYIWYFQSTPEHPDWMPFENSIFMLQPNPDSIYHIAPVTGDGVYRIVGYRGDNPVMGFAIGRGMFGTVEPKPGLDNYDADKLTLGDDGSFEVIFSTEKPKDWKGDWRYLAPDAGDILIRQFSYDWGNEREAKFAIERLDRPAWKPRRTIAETDEHLELLLGRFVGNFTRMILGYQNNVLKNIGANNMELTGFQDLGNSTEWPQTYWRCMYDFQPGEALIVETDLPEKCKYWNVQINDVLWNMVEFGYRQSSLNGHQARLDSDGKFRAVLALEDPGVPNWLDTGGYQQGMLVGRWYDADSHPTPTIKKVPLSDVRNHLPEDTAIVTPEERDEALRRRNIGMQMRRRW